MGMTGESFSPRTSQPAVSGGRALGTHRAPFCRQPRTHLDEALAHVVCIVAEALELLLADRRPILAGEDAEGREDLLAHSRRHGVVDEEARRRAADVGDELARASDVACSAARIQAAGSRHVMHAGKAEQPAPPPIAPKLFVNVPAHTRQERGRGGGGGGCSGRQR